MAIEEESKTASPAPLKRKRDRDGCMNCRRKKRKCAGAKPRCSNCKKSNVRCEWRQPLKFRPENTFTLDDTNSLTDDQHRRPPSTDQDPVGNQTKRRRRSSSNATRSDAVRTPTSQPNDLSGIVPPSTFSPTSEDSVRPNSSLSFAHDVHANQLDQLSPQNDAAQLRRQQAINDAGVVVSSPAQLITSPYQTLNPELNPELSPSMSSDHLKSDGIFLPGSEYQEFHTLLRNGMLNTAYNDPLAQVTSNGTNGVGMSGASLSITPQNPLLPLSHLATDGQLTKQLECELWQNWFMEVSTWIDKFDEHKHFRHTLPIMAKQHKHLKFAILALSARQLEMKDHVLPESISLGLYQEAIHHVLPAMETRNTAVIASCVVLAVLEMLSCSPKAWRRHLDGCAELIRTMDIRGDCGGVEQALFWCIVRMDVVGGLISSESTLIPVDLWTSNEDFDADTVLLMSQLHFEQYANYACYLLARVLDFFARNGVFSDRSRPASYTRDWTKIYERLLEWFDKRPSEMQPVVNLPAEEVQATSGPFDTLIFSNGAAISGNQLCHTAMLMMLQRKPKHSLKPQRSALWHARKICSITISNPHHGCWTNSIQPLWIAGQLMSHPSEHQALINMFQKIEIETGWGATWRARDLQAHWGDLALL